jgi:hypothetical protein
VLRRLILRERDAASGLDRLQPQRAIGRASGEHHADCLMRLFFRQGLEELVDGSRLPVRLARQEMQRALRDGHGPAWWNHVHMIRLNPRLVVDLEDRHRRGPRQDLR